MRALRCVGVAVALLVAGCGTDSQPADPTPVEQAPNWPRYLTDFRFRWTAQDGLDLTTGWAVPLRAYLESWLLTYFTDDLRSVYPGFDHATPPLLQEGSPEWRAAPYAQRRIAGYRGSSPVGGGDVVGNEQLHILSTEPIPQGFRAIVCDSQFGVYTRNADTGMLRPAAIESAKTPDRADTVNMRVWRIEFTDRQPAAPGSPSTPQEGPLPAPTDDVFGPWFVTGAEFVSNWSDSDHPRLPPDEAKQRFFEATAEENRLRQQCLDWLGIGPEERMRIATTELDSPPAVEPAVPGWPG
ncbi:hypothetical protein [Mycolicibacterium sp.]|uniref:hypothetical protein n=1 Tax=Mycolicibacterium sp. TaxID=2320850 RepID=UPI003D09E105